MKKINTPLIFIIVISLLIIFSIFNVDPGSTDATASGDSVLYMDVSTLNLPVSAVSGPEWMLKRLILTWTEILTLLSPESLL
ncbi:MAG: hypothetical protein R3A12_00900 [Ignavibacteria bacterium]